LTYNLFLIPIITGYFILTFSLLFKYNTQRLSKERMLFESILVGLLIIVGGFFFRIILDLMTCSKFIPWSLKILNILPINKPLYFWTFIFSSILSLLLFWSINKLIEKYYSKDDPIIWAVNKYGDEIEQLFKNSALDGSAIQITLKNDKVYIGFCEETPIPKLTNYLKLSPILSGYRDKETKKLKITTDYEKVVNKFIKDIEEKQGKELEKITLNTDVIIKQDEILTASIYEQHVFDEFNNHDDESENPKMGL
jgi:hypothetical protein